MAARLGVRVRTGWAPFDTGDDPNAAGALIGRQYLMLGLGAACAVPAGLLVLLGTLDHQPVLHLAGVLVGVATGVLGSWWGGRVAARRLDDRGAELMDLFNLGPQDRPRDAGTRAAPEPAAKGRRRDALVGTLVTVGIICLVPQGLVPVAFNLFGVDPEVKVWFAARYAPDNLQLLVAAGFILAGALALWWAETIRRHQAGRPSSGLARGPSREEKAQPPIRT
ncbi:MAG TPA: hypothetical protein VGR74_03175 [Actinomycetota bacterium]|nr:hypothetical protein [Actinomycetota bacterium]